MKAIYLTGLFFLALTFSVVAQVEPNILDDKYAPPGNSVFDEKASAKSNGAYVIKNAIFFEPGFFGRGVLGMSYYRQLGNLPFSVFISSGIILFKDYVPFIGDNVLENNILPDDGSDYSLSYIMGDFGLTDGNRRFLQFGTRYSFKTKGTFGSTGLEFGVRLYNYRLRATNRDYFKNGTVTDINTTTYYLNYCLQATGKARVPAVHSFRFGIGIKKISFDGFEEYYSDGYQYKLSGIEYTHLIPTIMLSYGVGFGW